jgi:hypothetical protein
VALASRSGKLVRTEELIDALRAEQLPGDPMNSLHAAVSPEGCKVSARR